jgi:hypothetical protein
MTEAHMEELDTVEPAYEDYFGFSKEEKYYLPDGKQYLLLTKMNEGARKSFQSETRSDLTLERTTGDARMKIDSGSQRWALLKASVTGWMLMRRGHNSWKAVEFTKTTFEQWLGSADPVIVDGLETAIRKLNPWLLQDMSVADIDKEISNLQEMREVAVKREQGEESSSGK